MKKNNLELEKIRSLSQGPHQAETNQLPLNVTHKRSKKNLSLTRKPFLSLSI